MNRDYHTGTKFNITLRVKSEYPGLDEADIIQELFRWQAKMSEDDQWADMSIVPGSMCAEMVYIPPLLPCD